MWYVANSAQAPDQNQADHGLTTTDEGGHRGAAASWLVLLFAASV
jgi:hypothetical protein